MVELEDIIIKINDVKHLLDKQKRSFENIENTKMKISSLVNNEGQTQRKLLAKILKYFLIIINTNVVILYLCRTYNRRRQVCKRVVNHIIRKVNK